MAKVDPLEQKLARLKALRDAPGSAEARRELAEALRSKSNVVAARAAEVLGQAGLSELAPALADAFDRFMDDPGRSDKGCRAKTAIAEALVTLAWPREGPFLRGLRHTQREPAYGGSVDTAAELRGLCALGLAQSGYADAASEVVELLADPEPAARTGAVRAIPAAAPAAAGALLRYKALVGDGAPEVLGECFAQLLSVEGAQAVPFVERFLGGAPTQAGAAGARAPVEVDPAVADAATVALGSSRLPAALDALRRRIEKPSEDDQRQTLLVALALHRSEPAMALLMGMVSDARPAVAAMALRALATYRHDARLRERVAAAVERRGDAAVRRAFDESFV